VTDIPSQRRHNNACYDELVYSFVYRNSKSRDFMCDFLIGVSPEIVSVFWCPEEEDGVSIIKKSFPDNLVLWLF
jgi:hypothetical protein